MPTSTVSSHYNKLPKLNLPTFGGNLLEWSAFWDSYNNSVHENPSLSNVQRFNYLKSQLYGEASQSISGMQMTNTNYNQAIQILHERFGQQHKIVNVYMQNLLNLPAPTPGIRGLKSFSDTIESNIRELEGMGRYQESYGSLLIPLILNKLPCFVRQNITRDHGNDDWDISSLRKAIKKEICIQEAANANPIEIDIIPSASFVTATTNKRWSAGSKDCYNNSSVKTKRPCLFCHNPHHPNECTKITDINARTQIVKEKRVCFNCFGNHKVSECRSKYSCRNCSKKHHSSICRNNLLNENSTSSEIKAVTKPVNEELQSTTETKSAAMHSAVTAHTEILLKTAVAPVWYHDESVMTNILFDEGAQNSFISQELVEKLNIKPTGVVSMQISAFGGKEGEVRNLEKATLSIETERKERIQMEVIIVPKIAAPIHMKKRVNINSLPYLRGLQLAHPVTQDEKFSISLLVGADYYWSLVQDEVIRGDGPTAVKSKIGYLLSGPLNTDINTQEWNSTMMNVLVTHKPDECDLQKNREIESSGLETDSDEIIQNVQNLMLEDQNSSITFKENKYVSKLPWEPPPLPKDRVKDTIPFCTSGIDITGPLHIKDTSHLLYGRIITTTEMHNDKHNANIQQLDTITANTLFEQQKYGLLED
ncbi:uncharacterized protein LOC134687869 [Mytilus trossulus]|uniref:uncharacterized protein LOC134687869 n=1 Tax=Mytilus trossulus TaxID=6551 RepID=UPI00300697F7